MARQAVVSVIPNAYSQGRQQGGDLARNFRAGFNFKLHRLAIRIGLQAELALPLNPQRSRFTRPVITLDAHAERRRHLAQGQYALGVVLVVPGFARRTVGSLAFMLRQQAAADVGGDSINWSGVAFPIVWKCLVRSAFTRQWS